MLRFYLLNISFFIVFVTTQAQVEKPNRLYKTSTFFQGRLNKFDSNSSSYIKNPLLQSKSDSIKEDLAGNLNEKIDSARLKIHLLEDSLYKLSSLYRAIDSIKILAWGDSLKKKINFKFNTDSLQLNRNLDSLLNLGVATKKINKYRDKYLTRINDRRSAYFSEVNGGQRVLQQEVTNNYNRWELHVKNKLKLDSLGVKLPGSNLNKVQGLNLPNQNLQLTNASIPNIQEIPQMPRLETSNFTNLNLSKDLKAIGGNWSVPSMNQLKQLDTTIPSLPQFQGYSKQLAEYKSMFKDPSSMAENAVKQIGYVNSISKELDQAANLKKQNEALQLAEKMKSDEALKDEAKKLAQKEAINHFKGQEQVLRGAMDQMSRYKKRYSSLNSLKDIPKNDWKPHNGLKGQPFNERFRIGLHTGIQNRKDTIILDFYPNASYKITGRIEAGIGAIYRVRTATKTYSLDQQKPVWGMASFVIIKTFKSTYFRTEIDGTSNPRSITSENPSAREWRWNFLAGVQTNYKISKSFTGNVQMLYNFEYNLKDKFPEALTLRFGVQYKMKAKRVK